MPFLASTCHGLGNRHWSLENLFSGRISTSVPPVYLLFQCFCIIFIFSFLNRYKSVLCQPLIGNDFTLVSEKLESFNDPKYSRHYIAVDRKVVDYMNEERLGPSEICKDFTADTGAHLLDFRGNRIFRGC